MKILVLLYGWSRANRKCKSHRAQTTHCYWLGIVGCGIVRDTGLTVSQINRVLRALEPTGKVQKPHSTDYPMLFRRNS